MKKFNIGKYLEKLEKINDVEERDLTTDFDAFKKMENIVRVNFLDVDLEDLLCEMDEYLDENDICESDIAYICIDFEVNPFKKLSLYYKK